MGSIVLLESYVSGFESKEAEGVCNGIFVIEKKYGLNIFPDAFRENGRLGVSNDKIIPLLRFVDVKPFSSDVQEHIVPYKLGGFMKKYSEKKLRMMALHLWNEGRSALYADERTKAKELVDGLPPLEEILCSE